MTSYAKVGQALRRARRERNLEIADVASELCLSEQQVKALEGGKLQDQMLPVYVSGFVRAYVRFLGLDDVSDLEDILVTGPCRPENVPVPEPVHESRMPSLGIVFGLITMLALGVLGWWKFVGTTSDMASDVQVPDYFLAVVDDVDVDTTIPLVLRTRETVGLRISYNGKVTFEGTLESDQRLNLLVAEGVKIETDNPAALNIQWDGAEISVTDPRLTLVKLDTKTRVAKHDGSQ